MARVKKTQKSGSAGTKTPKAKAPAKPRAKTKAKKAAAEAVSAAPEASPVIAEAKLPAPPLPDARPEVVTTLTHTEIAERAYAIWQAKGQNPGHDRDHWLEAESQLRQEHAIA